MLPGAAASALVNAGSRVLSLGDGIIHALCRSLLGVLLLYAILGATGVLGQSKGGVNKAEVAEGPSCYSSATAVLPSSHRPMCQLSRFSPPASLTLGNFCATQAGQQSPGATVGAHSSALVVSGVAFLSEHGQAAWLHTHLLPPHVAAQLAC